MKLTAYIPQSLSIAVLLLAGCHSAKDLPKDLETPIFLIPAGYQGTLNVVYGQKCGTKPEAENGHPVFRFSSDGTLILQENELFYSRGAAAYYFIDSAGNRSQISQVIDIAPGWTLDKYGKKEYFSEGNTTIEKYLRNEPVVVMGGINVHYLEPIQFINGKNITGKEASFSHMQYRVFSAGNLEPAAKLATSDDEERIKRLVRACKQRFAAASEPPGK